MDEAVQASQIYARVLYSLRRGCALWVPEPNNELSVETGVQIGDIGVLRGDGSFDFVFNACCSADDPVNRDGVPDDFQPLVWNGRPRTIPNYFRPNEPVLSRGAKKRDLGAEGSVSVPGTALGVGTGFSITFDRNQGAVILPPNGASSADCRNLTIFRKYAERYSGGWYKLINEKLGMEVENGSIYFITGFDKTNCWEIAVFSDNLKERMCEIFINTGGLAGGGRLKLSDASHHKTFSSRCSPSDNSNLNQALFIRGFRISMSHKLKSFFNGSSVEVTSIYESSYRDALGKKSSHFPFSRGGSSSGSGLSSSAGGPSPPSSSDTMDEASSPGTSHSDTSMEEDDLIPTSELYHPLKIINNYILGSPLYQEEGIKTVITHDEDWISLLSDEDVEMPDDVTLIKRLLDLHRITVKDGCAFIEHLKYHSQHSVLVDDPVNVKSKIDDIEITLLAPGEVTPRSLPSTPSYEHDHDFASIDDLENHSLLKGKSANASGEGNEMTRVGPRKVENDRSSSYLFPSGAFRSGSCRSATLTDEFDGSSKRRPNLWRLQSPTSSGSPSSDVSWFPLLDHSRLQSPTSSSSDVSWFPRDHSRDFWAESHPFPVRTQVGSVAMTERATSHRKKEAMFFCEVPGCQSRGFTERHNFQYHMRSHGNERPYGCPNCGRCFRSKSDLTRHSKKGKKPCENLINQEK